MNALMTSLKRYFPNENPTFVMAVMQDKSYGEMLDIMRENGYNTLRTVKVMDNPRAESAENLAKVAKEKGFSAVSYKSIRDALSNLNGLTVICGSLYLYKDFDGIRNNI